MRAGCEGAGFEQGGEGGFRGGDVHTYLAAGRVATDAPPLLRNFRSRPCVLRGIEQLYSHQAQAWAACQRGEMLDIRVLGLARIAPDVTPELARAAIVSLSVLGGVQASAAVKAALADRLR